jgi:hypothetical protein
MEKSFFLHSQKRTGFIVLMMMMQHGRLPVDFLNKCCWFCWFVATTTTVLLLYFSEKGVEWGEGKYGMDGMMKML